MTSRTYGYSRVSTLDQTTENQRMELAAAGFEVPANRWFADEGVSGAVPAMQRPQFVRLVDRLEEGDTLVVSKLDRLGRDAGDVMATVKALAARSVRVYVLALGGSDLTSTAGKLFLTVLSGVAEMERDLLIERTKAGMERARSQGKTIGRPAKTTPAQRTVIRQELNGGATVSGLAKVYNISRASVIAIRQRPSA